MNYQHTICTKKGPGLAFAKLEKCRRALDLFLTAVNVHDWHIDVVEEFSVKLDRVARGKEHHDLFLFVLFQKRKKKQKALIRWARDESLFEARCRCHICFGRDVDKYGIFWID